METPKFAREPAILSSAPGGVSNVNGVVVGREREIAEASGFLDHAAERSRGLLVVGEPGIGKTTLWEAVIQDAAARGREVLTARPSEAEGELAFAGLTDLLGRSRSGAADAPARAAVDAAIADARQWRSVHTEIRKLDDGGDYVRAVQLAVGTDQNSAASVFGRLDADLAGGISKGSDRFSRETDRAGDALGGASAGIGKACAIALMRAGWRVAWGDLGRAPRAVVLAPDDATVPLNTCYVVRAPTADDADALAAWLNAPLALAWLGAVAEPARGGYHRFLGWTMARLPLPADWTAARTLLAPAGRAARGGAAISAAELHQLTLRAFRVGAASMEPLVTWMHS